eukprot:TRINITY_DN11356_c0_g1_i1.p1 TRINITY_DN11356_c0_g1~~TRINITY_DN11356_c0_g1_i1.p1  ORF type:complete len:222 (-),score=70.46 TRINITY_DN11356_c0_g1_i1:77-742(-)
MQRKSRKRRAKQRKSNQQIKRRKLNEDVGAISDTESKDIEKLELTTGLDKKNTEAQAQNATPVKYESKIDDTLAEKLNSMEMKLEAQEHKFEQKFEAQEQKFEQRFEAQEQVLKVQEQELEKQERALKASEMANKSLQEQLNAHMRSGFQKLIEMMQNGKESLKKKFEEEGKDAKEDLLDEIEAIELTITKLSEELDLYVLAQKEQNKLTVMNVSAFCFVF